MDTFIKADIYFFVATIGVAFVALCVGIFFIALSMLAVRVKRMFARLEVKAGEMSDDVKDLIFDIRESPLLRMFIKGRKR